MMCGASRLKYNPVLAGPMTHTQPMVHTQVNFPQLQMLSSKNASADDDYDPSKFFSWSARRFNQPCGVVVPATTRSLVSYQKEGARRVWDLTRQISDQSFPPTVICGMNHKQLLKNWADSFQDPWGDSEADANSINASNHKNDLAPFLPSLHKHLEGDKATVLDKMRNVVGGFVDKLEMVSLIPKDLETPFLESGSSAVDASVLALGVFSRRQLDDDSMGSICELLEERFGKEWAGLQKGHATKQFEAFEIEGLADAPGLPEQSARVLLCKIRDYALQEQKIVVVSARAKRPYMGSDGKDVLDYYVRLGFEEVLMEDGRSELVYTGVSCSAEDCWVGNQQVMVGVNLETGV